MRCGIVVGYLGAGTTNENYTMVAGCFGKVGADGQYSLADLSVNGYDLSTLKGIAWTGGCTKGAFRLDVLKNDGNPSASYFWVDCTTGTKTKSTTYEAGWYKYVGGDYTKMESAEVSAIKFDVGQAFWTAGSGYNLVSSGEVLSQNMEYKTNDENFTAVGNGMPVDCTLGNLFVNGYDPSTLKGIAWTGGCTKGAFRLDVLKNDGNPSASYFWVDCTTGTKTKSTTYEAGWYKYVDGDYAKMTTEEVNAVKVKAGDGFWVAGSGYNLVAPSPLAEEKGAE